MVEVVPGQVPGEMGSLWPDVHLCPASSVGVFYCAWKSFTLSLSFVGDWFHLLQALISWWAAVFGQHQQLADHAQCKALLADLFLFRELRSGWFWWSLPLLTPSWNKWEFEALFQCFSAESFWTSSFSYSIMYKVGTRMPALLWRLRPPWKK